VSGVPENPFGWVSVGIVVIGWELKVALFGVGWVSGECVLGGKRLSVMVVIMGCVGGGGVDRRVKGGEGVI
jgi:hypothetical protein